MQKPRKIILIITALVAMLTAMLFVAACDDEPETYTLTFVTDGGTVISPIKAKAGEKITPPADPEKDEYEFAGWYLDKKFGGSAVEIPSVMPKKNVTYYAKFVEQAITLEYVFNLPNVQHSGEVAAQKGEKGQTVKVKDGADYKANGYRFVGWSINPTGEVAITGSKKAGQYNPDDDFTLGDDDAVLYAQWSREYVDARGKSSDKIYVYEPLIGGGQGAATLVRAGKQDKFGFVTPREESAYGYMEFEFLFEPAEGGDVKGRFYDDFTYAYAVGERRQFIEYDYVNAEVVARYLTMDEYDYAVVMKNVGNQLSVDMYGNYAYDEEYGDYVYEYTDSNGKRGEAFFTFELRDVANTEFDGYFMFQGDESGSYLQYDNGELLNYRLELNGYGSAAVYVMNTVEDTVEKIAEGSYRGTDNFQDVFGEWIFEPTGGDAQSFEFVLNTLEVGGEITYLYIEYNADYDVTFNAEVGNGTLELNGYGVAVYTDGGIEYAGNCVVDQALITFIPAYVNGVYDPDAVKMYFNVDFAAKTFTVNTDGYVVNNGVLTAYRGESPIAVIPDGITEVGDNAFNYASTLTAGTSLVSVTIPASVTKIGKNAFENNYTLRRAVFLSETPIAMDFSSESNPFRWPAGGFIIVVPEGSQDEYRAAWSDCPYAIKGSEEVTRLPEFEIEGTTLVRYNKPDGSADIIDVKIPDEVTEIANGAFLGATFLGSVDLNNVVRIGENAFYGCQNLVEVVFTSVREIGAAAFLGCSKLSSSGVDDILELPAIVEIGDNAFQSCEAIRRIVLGENLASIGNNAFYECQIYENQPSLYIELSGATPPQMGEKVTVGNISVKIQIKDIDVAIACFNESSWSPYCRHLCIPSGAEKGEYMYGDILLVLDGRAEIQGSMLMWYEIDGKNITFYEYEGPGAFTPTAGTIENDTVRVTFGGVAYEFTRVTGERTYTTEDGKYTLRCNPLDLVPSATGASSQIDATFNGTAVKISISGYSTKRINAFTDSDGKKYDITLSFDGETLIVTKRAADIHLRGITAEDGSEINIHYMGSLVFVYGELKINVGTETAPQYLVWSDGATMATFLSDNTFMFTRDYAGVKYDVIVTLSDDGRTFEYTYTTTP